MVEVTEHLVLAHARARNPGPVGLSVTWPAGGKGAEHHGGGCLTLRLGDPLSPDSNKRSPSSEASAPLGSARSGSTSIRRRRCGLLRGRGAERLRKVARGPSGEVLAPGGGPEARASGGHQDRPDVAPASRPKSVCRTPGKLHRRSLEPFDSAEAEPRLLALGRRVVHVDDDGLADPELLPQD